LSLVLGGCEALPGDRASSVNDPECLEACTAQDQQCPQIFAAFPGRAAIECPTRRADCAKSCEKGREGMDRTRVVTTRAPITAEVHAAAPPATATPRAMSSKEAQLRELKDFHDKGLITDDVYSDHQKAILAEP
jgi:hypothetical protein